MQPPWSVYQFSSPFLSAKFGYVVSFLAPQNDSRNLAPSVASWPFLVAIGVLPANVSVWPPERLSFLYVDIASVCCPLQRASLVCITGGYLSPRSANVQIIRVSSATGQIPTKDLLVSIWKVCSRPHQTEIPFHESPINDLTITSFGMFSGCLARITLAKIFTSRKK